MYKKFYIQIHQRTCTASCSCTDGSRQGIIASVVKCQTHCDEECMLFYVEQFQPNRSADSADEGGLTVKYLSSSRLMGLQLRDAGFRRHFLLQALLSMIHISHIEQLLIANVLV